MTIQTILKLSALAAVLAIVPSVSSAMGFYVSVQGVDANDGSVSKPLQTIATAGLAQPADTGNLLHDNDEAHELFVEVNHGPDLVDNNIFLSSKFLLNWPQGGAFVHNLMTGTIYLCPELRRGSGHQFHKSKPCVLSRSVDVPLGEKTTLELSVRDHDQGDWKLVVRANDREILSEISRPISGRISRLICPGTPEKPSTLNYGSKRTDGVLKELIGTGSRSSASDAIRCVS